MPRQRKVIVYVATSADGYIARLNRRPHKCDYGMKQFYASIDTILLGRKTYDWAVNYYKKSASRRSSIRRCRTSSSRASRREILPSGVEFVTKPVKTFMRQLRAQRGKHIWMMGGGALIASFLDAGLRYLEALEEDGAIE